MVDSYNILDYNKIEADSLPVILKPLVSLVKLSIGCIKLSFKNVCQLAINNINLRELALCMLFNR